jgi:hypothetical protein
MSERKSHIDDHFIPEGLEFREEYMHTALGNYRRKKRAILWGKIGVVAVILMTCSAVSIVLWNKPENNSQTDNKTSNSIIEQKKIPTDSLSTLDLDNDEGTFNRNRQSPAVESSEATQDLSTKAVDKGDPMSSGVGLPGQLSTSKKNLQTKATTFKQHSKGSKVESLEATEAPSYTAVGQGDSMSSGFGLPGRLSTFESNLHDNMSEPAQSATPSMEVTANQESAPANHNNHQNSASETLENQALARPTLPSDMPYLPFHPWIIESQLQPQRPLPQLPINRWSVFASLGTKLWADYGFGSGPAQLDPIIGLGIDYKWRKKMSYYLAGQFFTVSGVAAPYVSTQRQYGEGFSETTYSYHTDRFYHAGLSFGASYRVSTKHSISIFTECSALLTADNRIETGTSSSYESRTANEVKARGYVQGFRSLQQSVGLSYEYALGRNKFVGASYRHGLTDITVNSFFGNAVNRNSMLSFYFKLKLTR